MSDPTPFLVPNPENPKEQNIVWFEWGSEKNDEETNANGVPVFDTVLLAHVQGPGLMRSEAVLVVERKKPDGKVIENHRIYGPMIKAFKENDAGGMTGTPLSELAMLDSGIRATFKAMGVHSVEALASLADVAAERVMGFHKFKQAAQAFIAQRDGQQPMAKLTSELEIEREKNRQLEATVAALDERLKELEKPKRKAA